MAQYFYDHQTRADGFMDCLIAWGGEEGKQMQKRWKYASDYLLIYITCFNLYLINFFFLLSWHEDILLC